MDHSNNTKRFKSNGRTFQWLKRYKYVFVVCFFLIIFNYCYNPTSPGEIYISSENKMSEIRYVEENLERMEQDDPRLIRYVRSRYVTPPSGKPLNMKNPRYQKTDLGNWVRAFYKDKKHGIFFEAGANDGESSNTIQLEIELGWTGILVECNPKVTPHLINAHRNAWVVSACLSRTKHPARFNMSVPETWDYSARMGPAWDLSTFGVNSNWTYFDGVESAPMYSIISAVGIQEFDYFSFDIEGSELDVLKTFMFDKIRFKVLILEVHFYSPNEKIELRNLLGRNGLLYVRDILMDQIYVHKSLLSDEVTLKKLAKI